MENELERPAAAVAPVARSASRMSEGRVARSAVGVGEG